MTHTFDNDWQARLIAQLDRDQPGWQYSWAEAQDFRDARDITRMTVADFIARCVADRLFRTILQAALGAKIVSLPQKDA